MRNKRIPIAIIALLASISWGCEPKCSSPPCVGHRRDLVPALIESAKADIAAKDYAAAFEKCLRAEEIDDTLAEAKYCVLLANLGALMQTLTPPISCLIQCVGLGPAGYEAGKYNAKEVALSMFTDIEQQMLYIDRYAAKLAAFDNPTITLDDFPLGLDVATLFDVLGIDVQSSGYDRFNLKGAWDKSEVMLLGAGVNAAQSVVDYLLAHTLVIDTIDGDFQSSNGFARFLALNPSFFVADPKDAARISGDDEERKGLRKDILAALSFAVGRESDLELVGPKSGGLVEAIKQSAAVDRADAVIRWIDKDGDGIPEYISIPAFAGTDEFDERAYGYTVKSGVFENPLSKVTWNKLISLGKALRHNIEHGGDPVPLRGALQALADDMRADKSDLRLAYRPVPDVIALDLHAFLEDPPYLSELVPYYFTYSLATTSTVHYDLAYEVETYDADTGEWFVKKGGYEAYRGGVADLEHFSYVTPDVFSASVTVDAYDFGAFAAPAKLTADGITADARSPQLPYVALQDPTFGGLVAGDPSGQGNYGPLDNASFNQGIARLVKYYCLDLSKGIWDSVHDGLYVNNDIATCTGAF